MEYLQTSTLNTASTRYNVASQSYETKKTLCESAIRGYKRNLEEVLIGEGKSGSYTMDEMKVKSQSATSVSIDTKELQEHISEHRNNVSTTLLGHNHPSEIVDGIRRIHLSPSGADKKMFGGLGGEHPIYTYHPENDLVYVQTSNALGSVGRQIDSNGVTSNMVAIDPKTYSVVAIDEKTLEPLN